MDVRRCWMAGLLALMACGGREPPEELPPLEELPRSSFIPAERTAVQASSREGMRYVAVTPDAGEQTTADGGSRAVVRARMGGRPVELAFAVELVALRIADVPTLEYPVGVVKLDTRSLGSGDARRDTVLLDTVLRTLGSPVQIFFDVHSVGDLQGRLAGEGSSARGQVLGKLQIDDRQQDLAVDALFRRPTLETLEIEVPPFELSLEAYDLDEKLARAAKKLGLRTIDPKVEVGFTLALQAFEGEQLPMFVRTPVTVNRTEDVRERLDAEIDDHEAASMSLRRQGLPPAVAGSVSEKWYEQIQRLKRERGKSGPVFGDDERLPR